MLLKSRLGLFLCLTGSGTLTIAFFVACQFIFHSTLLTLYGNFIFALGGMTFGSLASLGAIPWARYTGTRPTRGFALVTASAALVSLLLFYTTTYWLAVFADIPGAQVSGFLGYMDAIHGHAHMRVGSTDEVGSDIGRGGYALLALNFLWAGICGMLPAANLGQTVHCDSCAAYFKLRKKQVTTYPDQHDFSRAIAGLPDGAADRAAAILHLQQWQKVKEKRGVVRLALKRSECPSCRMQSMEETVSVHNGKHFVRVNGTKYRWSPTPSAKSEPQVQNAGAVGGFGRKGT